MVGCWNGFGLCLVLWDGDWGDFSVFFGDEDEILFEYVVKIEGWVKIYNVKMVKTEMACAPHKTGQNQKSFWIPSK